MATTLIPRGLGGPGVSASQHIAVTPSDTTFLVGGCSYLLIGQAGTVAVIDGRGVSVTYTTVAANELIRVKAARVMATGTTATGIVALYGLDTGNITAEAHRSVTPSDATDGSQAFTDGLCSVLLVGVAGTVTVVDGYGNVAQYTTVNANDLIRVQAISAHATGTSASGIVALY